MKITSAFEHQYIATTANRKYEKIAPALDQCIVYCQQKYNSCIQIIYILRKTIEGYGFCFDFVAKGIIFSTQIINRYVAEPSLCKDSIKFSRCLEALLADLQKCWNTPEIEVLQQLQTKI